MARNTPSHSASGAVDTREKILEVAGRLFAEHGFRAVALRRITQEAEVNLAAVNYHFGSKEALIAEVLSSVVGPINRERLRLLNAAELEACGEPAPVEKVLEAIFAPLVSFMGSEESNRKQEIFLKLAGRCMSERAEVMPETMLEVFKEVLERFQEAFEKSLPGLPRKTLFWRMHFSAGAMLYSLTQPEHLQAFSKGEVDALDSEENLRQLVEFTAAGMRAEAGRAKRKARTSKKPGAVAAPAIAAALALFSASCAAVSPDSMNDTLDVKTAAAYTAGKPGSGRPLADSDWISRFGDSRLDALVTEALANNKDLKIAEARLRAAEATVDLAGVDRRPKLDGGFRGSRAKQNFIGFPFGGDEGGGGDQVLSSLSNSFGLSLDLSWEIDLWGRIRTEQQGAIAALEASEADMAGVQLSIAAQTAKTWFALIEAKQQQQLAQRTLELFRKTEKSISEKFERGIEDQPGSDLASQLRLARTDIASAEETLVQREQSIKQVARQLETVLARYPSAEVKSGSSLPKIPSAPPAGVPASLLDRRPDLVAAERRLAAADRKYAAARLQVLPAISLTGSGGTASEMVENLLDKNFSVWNLAGNAVQPILARGAIREGIKLRKNEIVEAAGSYEKSVLVAFREVEDALDLEQFLARREKLLADTVALADEAYQKSLEEMAGGVGDILTLLSAQQRKVQSGVQLISIRRLRLDNRVDLHLALGGDYRARRKS